MRIKDIEDGELFVVKFFNGPEILCKISNKNTDYCFAVSLLDGKTHDFVLDFEVWALRK